MRASLSKRVRLALLLAIMSVVISPFVYRFLNSSPRLVQHESAHHGSATIVSVTRYVPKRAPSTSPLQDQYTVCFKVDDWGKVHDDPRYEKAEQERERTVGPPCVTVFDMATASKLKPEDKIEVVYLLENDFKMDFPEIIAHGVTLTAY